MADPLAVPGGKPVSGRALVLAGVLVAVAIAVVTLLWAKWLPYQARVGLLSTSRTWSGGSILEVNGTPGLHYHYQVVKQPTENPIAVPILERLLSSSGD